MTPCIVPRGGFLYRMIVQGGKVFAPFKSCPGGMVMDEIDTCITHRSAVPVVEFCKQKRFLLFVFMGMLTTDMTVYPCEQNQNRYENGLDACEHRQINLRSRNKTGLTGLQFGT